MTHHPTITSEATSSASLPFDAPFDSIESLTTSFTADVVPTLETTTVTEVALGYHRNQQYSITAMTTTTGAVAERYAYTAYGQPTILNASGTVLTTSAVGNRYTYTGREWDATLGLHHFRARWMSPLAGRFLGRDPIGFEGSEWDLYEYSNSFPLIAVDPEGLACWFCGTIDSVQWLFDSSGKTIGCALKYAFDQETTPRSYSGKACPKECEPVATCDDLPNLQRRVIVKIVGPIKKDGRWVCPLKSEVAERNCQGINAKNCKGDHEEQLKSCKDACKDLKEAARRLCMPLRGIRVEPLQRACMAFVQANVDNCM